MAIDLKNDARKLRLLKPGVKKQSAAKNRFDNNSVTPSDVDNITEKVYEDLKVITEGVSEVKESLSVGDGVLQKLNFNSSTGKVEVLSPLDTSTFIGWQDFADSNTSESLPLLQSTVSGGEVHLTNNNNDTLTDGNTSVNAETSVTDLNDLWNTTANTFDFDGTGLEKNDLLSMRIHTNISASIIAQDFSLRLDFYDAPGGSGNYIFSLSQHVATEALSAGVFRERITVIDAFVGESVLSGSAKLYLVGTKSFEVEVIGFNLRIFKIAR